MVRAILELTGVNKNFILKRTSIFEPHRILPAVKNVSLSIKPGERFGIIGESGWEVTLARLMVGLYTPDGGLVRLEVALAGYAGIRSQSLNTICLSRSCREPQST